MRLEYTGEVSRSEPPLTIFECVESPGIESLTGKTKTMHKLGCRDMGVDCDFVATGETKEEVIAKGVEHGKQAHGMGEMTEEQKQKAMAAMKEE